MISNAIVSEHNLTVKFHPRGNVQDRNINVILRQKRLRSFKNRNENNGLTFW